VLQPERVFGIGATELVIIGVVLLIAVGPSRLPKLLKAVVSAYREFRRATRELRASTGIDELLQDEDLRELRKPLHVQAMGTPKKPLAAQQRKPTQKRALTYTERIQENPPEGVDLAELRDAENRPSEEEREAIVAAKKAKLADEDAIRQAKIAAADGLTEEERAERIAAKEAAAAADDPLFDDDDEEERIAAKLAAAEPEPFEDEEAQGRIDAKLAAAQEAEAAPEPTER